MSVRACYRYRTTVLVGPWRRRPQVAIVDAIVAGQARLGHDGAAHWIVAGDIEESACDYHGPCGGTYPSD